MNKMMCAALLTCLCACNAHSAALVAMNPEAVRQRYSADYYSQVECYKACFFEVGYKGKLMKYSIDFDLKHHQADIRTFNYFEKSPGEISSVSFEIQCNENYLKKLPAFDENNVYCFIFFEPNQTNLSPVRIEIVGINEKGLKKEYIFLN